MRKKIAACAKLRASTQNDLQCILFFIDLEKAHNGNTDHAANDETDKKP